MKRSVMTGRRAVERGDWVEAALRSKGGEAASSKYKALWQLRTTYVQEYFCFFP